MLGCHGAIREGKKEWDDLRIIQIAYEVGFGDISNFDHAFRRRCGATP
jgi:AraC-like DNA-binding protein